MLEHLFTFIFYLVSFLTIISILVFVHEFGHFIVARFFKVKVEVFSIGFGKEIWGFNDKHDTRWKFSAIPLGGYVKMFGDTNEASSPSSDIFKLPKEKKAGAFFFKPLGQKFLIVLAGPLMNYIFAIIIIAGFLIAYGTSYAPNIISSVTPGDPAAIAGLKKDDKITKINNSKISDFNDIARIVLISPNIPLNFTIDRDGETFQKTITPKTHKQDDGFGNINEVGLIGIAQNDAKYVKVSVLASIPKAIKETYDISATTLSALGQILTGKRSIKDLHGPVKIAHYSGQVTDKAIETNRIELIIWFIAMISINLGLVNLFPIPMLDGGHLFFYAIEFIKRSPVSFKTQEIIYRIGFAFLLVLFMVITFNDIKGLILS